MKKKIEILLAALFLLLQPVLSVSAAPEENAAAEAVSGYCLGDELYAFLRIEDGYDTENMKVNVKSDDIDAEGEASMIPITKSGSIMRYVFMIDLTGSMSSYVDEVNAFVDTLTAEERSEAFYTVATFGERFEIVKENLTDKNTVTKALGELNYTEQLTDPYTGVESALTYLDSYSRRSGDLINLIIITDGDPDLGDELKDREKELAESAAEKIADTPEVIVSTLCTAEWDETAYKALSAGRGIHEKIDDDQDAEAAGKKIVQYVDGLYRTSFKLTRMPDAERFSVELRMQGSNLDGQLTLLTTSLSNVPNLKAFSNDIPGEESDEKPVLAAPEEKEPDISEEKPAEGEGITSEGETEEEPGEENEANESTRDEATPMTEEKETTKNNLCLLYILIPIACVVIAAVICLIVLWKRKNANGRKVSAKTPAGGAIPMKLEVYAGNYAGRTSMLYLADTLTIGSAPECDLIFRDSKVEPMHARIFMKNQIIYIEDLNTGEGTALGGMRIQGQNRLRSGDVISIGAVEFSLKF